MNYNEVTKIRYGTVYLNELDGDVSNEIWDAAATDYYERQYQDMINNPSDYGLTPDNPEDDETEWCYDDAIQEYNDSCCNDEITGAGEYEGITFELSMLGGAYLVFITESPVIVHAELCSPCVPGAGDLSSLNVDGVECYGIPADWRQK